MITASEAAAHLSISEREVYNLVATGRLVCYKLGPRLTRFKIEDLDRFIESCRLGGSKKKSASVSSSAVSCMEKDIGLLASFRRLGVEVKQTPTTGKKRRASMPVRLVSSNPAP